MANNDLIMLVPTASELKVAVGAITVEKALADDEWATDPTIILFSLKRSEAILRNLEKVQAVVDHAKSADTIMDAYKQLHWWGCQCRHDIAMKITLLENKCLRFKEYLVANQSEQDESEQDDGCAVCGAVYLVANRSEQDESEQDDGCAVCGAVGDDYESKMTSRKKKIARKSIQTAEAHRQDDDDQTAQVHRQDDDDHGGGKALSRVPRKRTHWRN
jgi:hypothetical protein